MHPDLTEFLIDNDKLGVYFAVAERVHNHSVTLSEMTNGMIDTIDQVTGHCHNYDTDSGLVFTSDCYRDSTDLSCDNCGHKWYKLQKEYTKIRKARNDRQ